MRQEMLAALRHTGFETELRDLTSEQFQTLRTVAGWSKDFRDFLFLQCMHRLKAMTSGCLPI